MNSTPGGQTAKSIQRIFLTKSSFEYIFLTILHIAGARRTRRASTLPERTPRIQSQRRAELSSDGDGQTFKYLYIQL